MQEMEKITLKPERAEFVKEQVKAGRFKSANDALDKGVELLQKKYEEGKEAYRDAIKKGLESGVGENLSREESLARIHAKYLNK